MLILAVVLGILGDGGGGGYHAKKSHHYDEVACRHQAHYVLNGSSGQNCGAGHEDAGDEDLHLHQRHPFLFMGKGKGYGGDSGEGAGEREMQRAKWAKRRRKCNKVRLEPGLI